MDLQQRINKAVATGRLWISGEMELPYPCTFYQAFAIANRIAEDCGYIVTCKGTRSRLHIVGGDIPGEIVLDWFDGERLGPVAIEHWSVSCAYFPPAAAEKGAA